MAELDTLPDVRLGEFEVEYVLPDHRQIRARLLDVSDLAFERAEPVQEFRFSRGQSHFRGGWLLLMQRGERRRRVCHLPARQSVPGLPRALRASDLVGVEMV